MPKGADCRRARTAEGRELPRGADCRGARTAEGRGLPKGADVLYEKKPGILVVGPRRPQCGSEQDAKPWQRRDPELQDPLL